MIDRPHYHDLARLAREDPAFARRILEASEKHKDPRDAKQLILESMRAAFYNCGFLLPHFFPTFMGPGAPMSLQRRAFAFPMYALMLYGFLVIRGSRQISKSTNLSARQLILTSLLDRWVSFYIAPHTEHVRTYANKLEEMKRFFRYRLGDKTYKDNMYLKEVQATGGRIELHRVLTSSEHLRGKTADEILFDEYQLFDAHLEGAIAQCQRVSERPVTIYSGTSTTLDSPLEVRFAESSGGVWHMKSPDGKRSIDCSDPTLFLKMIRPQGLTCPYTERLITDPLDGEWVHARPSEYTDNNRLGIHVPQILIPDFTKPSEWVKIYDYLKRWGEQKTIQEVGGIPVESGMRELTKTDLMNMCSLPYTDAAAIQEATLRKNPYQFIVSGADWGGSDYQMAHNAKTSYTLHTMLGVRSDGTMDILHMKDHSGMAYDGIGHQISTQHVRMGGTAIASDYGVGMQYNTFLHRHPQINPASHWVFQYGPPYMAMMKRPPQAMFSTHLLLNKTESVTQLIMAIKSGRIRCYSWAAAEHLLSWCLNCFRVHSETKVGKQFFQLISNPATPNDTLHSLNYAFTMARLLRGEQLLQDEGMQAYLGEQLSYIHQGSGGSGGLYHGADASYVPMTWSG